MIGALAFEVIAYVFLKYSVLFDVSHSGALQCEGREVTLDFDEKYSFDLMSIGSGIGLMSYGFAGIFVDMFLRARNFYKDINLKMMYHHEGAFQEASNLRGVKLADVDKALKEYFREKHPNSSEYVLKMKGSLMSMWSYGEDELIEAITELIEQEKIPFKHIPVTVALSQ